MKNDPQTDVATAVNVLVHGYGEEAQLYMRIRRLTWKQHDTLHEEWDLDQFQDLLDQKEDLLQMAEQIEAGMQAARAIVLSRGPSACPDRVRLDMLLDHIIEIIEEIWIVESDNASFLNAILLEGSLSGMGMLSAGS
jgi:hypothetical protein